jgi:hypothetical protein
MIRTAAGRLLAFTVLSSLGAAASHGTEVSAARRPLAHPRAELAAAAQIAAEQGFHSELPPHISTLLGLTREERCPVRQGVLRFPDKIQGIDVTEKNHDDIVIFVVDATGQQTFYLTSPAGTLRRMLSVKKGVGVVVKPTEADVEGFQKEKKMWEERLAVDIHAK